MLKSLTPISSRGLLRRFARNENGNIAVLFSIAVLPILTFVGAAVDYTRVSTARTAMQSALDSATLMVSKDLSSGAIKTSDVNAKAQVYFASLYNNKDVSSINVAATYTAKDSQGKSTISVTGKGSITTEFMKIAGYPKLDFSTASTTTWGGTRMRVAMALDVTGSMGSAGKMPAMQDAAKKLIDTLKGLGTTADDVYVSIIPFAQMVSVGVSNKNAAWLKWDGLGSCSSSNWYYAAYMARFSTKEGCQTNGGTWTSSSGKGSWKGCVTDRDKPADTTNTPPVSSATNYQAVLYLSNGINICPADILPMTSAYSSDNVTKIKDKIDDLVPNGGTNQPIGMAWAWQTLLPGDPLGTPAKDPLYKYNDVIILLSDGLNTINRYDGNGSDVSPEVDSRQRLLCDNIKVKTNGVQEISIYTIQVNTDNDPESAVLKYCADDGKFFPTSTADGIASAFSAIGASLSQLRIAQ